MSNVFCIVVLQSFFFNIRTSNFGAEIERSYIFSDLRLISNVLNMFLNLNGIKNMKAGQYSKYLKTSK